MVTLWWWLSVPLLHNNQSLLQSNGDIYLRLYLQNTVQSLLFFIYEIYKASSEVPDAFSDSGLGIHLALKINKVEAEYVGVYCYF